MAQAIFGHPDTRSYNPARDLARIWPAVVDAAAKRLLDGKGVGGEYLRKSELDPEVVKAGLAAFVAFLKELQKDNPIVLQEAIAKTQLMQQDPTLLLALFASLGASFLGAIYGATLDLKVLDDEPPVSNQVFHKVVETLSARI